MNPHVRNLYKRLMIVGRDYPLGLDFIRNKTKIEFRKNAHLKNDFEIKKSINNGRWWVKEIHAITTFKKYRVMKARYGNPWL